MGETILRDGELILFIGDSITDCGRRDCAAPLGNGYVKFFSDFLQIREPQKEISILNQGIGGNTVQDLRERWEQDVLEQRFDWISVKIGINDVHRYLCDPANGVSPEQFKESYQVILEQTRQVHPKARILLIDPFYVAKSPANDPFMKTVLESLPAYIETVHRMSESFGARLVPTHDIFQGLLRYKDPTLFCPEPVHPYPIGHLVIAEQVYRALSMVPEPGGRS